MIEKEGEGQVKRDEAKSKRKSIGKDGAVWDGCERENAARRVYI